MTSSTRNWITPFEIPDTPRMKIYAYIPLNMVTNGTKSIEEKTSNKTEKSSDRRKNEKPLNMLLQQRMIKPRVNRDWNSVMVALRDDEAP